MRWLMSAVVVVAACKGGDKPAATTGPAGSAAAAGSAAPPPSEPAKDDLARFDEGRARPWTGVLIAPGGVWVNRRKLGTLDELEKKPELLGMAVGAADENLITAVAFTLKDEKSSVAYTALSQLMSARPPVSFYVGDKDCGVTLVAKQDMKKSPVLSVTVTATDAWFGVSRINDFQQSALKDGAIDDGNFRLSAVDHKADALFDKRTDAELAATDDAKAQNVFLALHGLCAAGFTQVAVLPLDKLEAKVGL